MQVSTANDVKIYNLSSGKSLPQWMSNEARRKLERKNFDVRRRIQLIQDFEMPDISRTVDISPDGRYVFATGAYKPWLKCYDLNDLSLKFERGVDADIVKLLCLSDDYSKIVLLQEERYIEMHAAFGRYFRMRMPRFGRDMAFSRECSDLYLVGASSEIYRLNLEQGEWLSPLQTQSASINCCQFADTHQLFVCGTADGQVEAWDHRDKNRVGILDCIPPILDEITGSSVEITSLKFRDALHLAVGTSSGHVLLYDLRSKEPLLVKDHNNGLPIKKMDFAQREDSDLVLSMDSRVLKMWHSDTGKPFAAIETETALTDFARYPDSGLMFFANEAPRMLQYFVPSLGTAPKWCSFLETITEELEESQQPTVYDDYKFVTKQQLEDLGLSHLIGSTVLRAYMHGYFIDVRLYKKAFTLTQPFAYESYKDRKIRDLLESERDQNLVKKTKEKLPAINKDLAVRLRKEAAQESAVVRTGKKLKNQKKKAEVASSILEDDRFKRLFESEDFQVDTENEQYVRIMGQKEKAAGQKKIHEEIDEEEEEGESDEEEENIAQSSLLYPDEPQDVDMNGSDSDLESNEESSEESDSEKAAKAKEKLKRRAEALKRKEEKYFERKRAEKEERKERLANKPKKFVLHELGAGETSRKFMDEMVATNKNEGESVSMRKKRRSLKKEGQLGHVEETPFGGRAMTFKIEKKGQAGREEREKMQKEAHRKERKEVVRATTDHVSKSLKKLPANLNLKKTAK